MEQWELLELELRKKCPHMEVRRNERLARHTSFRVGGPAALMALPRTEEEAVVAVAVAYRQGIRPYFLGNGSNLLVSDRGYDGYVIRTAGLKGAEWEKTPQGEDRLTAECGVPLARLANLAAEKGFTGLEWASGIPGTLGGAVVMNAGAYGGELSQVVDRVFCMTEKGDRVTLDGKDCEFAYRRSVFSRRPDRMALKVALLPLKPEDPEKVRRKMEELALQRAAKQPLEYPSAGSTFKRPAPLPDGTPVYAAALIDRCGLKGLTEGGAQVSEKHAGFIINRGGATCKDILTLIGEVQKRVYGETGVELEPEVRMLGV